MEKQNISDLISKAKASGQKKIIQKVVPIDVEITDKEKSKTVQFSFHTTKELLKKIKLKAFLDEKSMKQIVVESIEKYID